MGGTFQPSWYLLWALVTGTKDDSILNWPLAAPAQVGGNFGIKHRTGQKDLGLNFVSSLVL